MTFMYVNMFGKLLLVFFLIVTSCGKKKENTVVETVAPDGVQLQPQPFGTNLSGAEFGANVPGQHQQDYSYPLVTDLNYFKSKNMMLVRLPFKWERVQPVLYGPLDPVELKRLTDFIDAAAVRDILIIPDVHNFARRVVNGNREIIGTSLVPTTAFTDFWGKLAEVLKTKKNIWAYGVMNEPFNMPSNIAWFSIAQATINKIREIDQKTAILVGGDSYSSAERWPQVSENLKTLRDDTDNLIFEAHVYFDDTSAGTYDGTYDQEKATPQTGVNRLRPFVEWLKTNKKRGFIGEYGIPDDDPRWLVVLDNMLKYMKENNINGTYWSAGPRWGTYRLAIQPRNGIDRPQMQILQNYQTTSPTQK
ncbi:MAG: glycoside hydrolase family 5 protein [Pedobacter sp.]